MAVLPRASRFLGASAVLCALLLRAQGSAPATADSEEDDCEALLDDGDDSASLIQRRAQRLTSEATFFGRRRRSPRAEVNSSKSSGASKPIFLGRGDESKLKLPGADYPEQLRGVIWMDQSGAYGKSDTSAAAAPDLLVSFAGSLDLTSRKTIVSPTGPGWTWQNNEEAYGLFKKLEEFDFEYEFAWNENYTEAKITPTVYVSGHKLSSWSVLSDFRMSLQKPAGSECPPRPHASKDEVNKCALWLRKSWVPVIGWATYPVFRILDEAGNPVQPYYDAYVAHAKKTAKPNPSAAEALLGYDEVKDQDVWGSLWFVGTGGAAQAKSEAEGQKAIDDLNSFKSFGLV